MYGLMAVTADVNTVKNFLQQLPEKALDLGLRVLLAVVFFLVGR